MTQRIAVAIEEVRAELNFANENFPALHSAHEAYGVLLEEMRELEEHVFKNRRLRDYDAMRKEACQVAAMAIRLMVDLC